MARPRTPKKRKVAPGYTGERAVAIAACAYLKAKAGTPEKDKALDRLQKAMDKYGPFPKKKGPPFGTHKKIPHEQIEIRQARKRIKEKRKLRLRRSPEEHAKKGPAWVAHKRRINAKLAAEAAAKLELELEAL